MSNTSKIEVAFPTVIETDGSVTVDLRQGKAEPVRQVTVKAVLDLDWDGGLLGIEILDLLHQLGPDALRAWDKGPAPFAYADEVDAFSLFVKEGRSRTQPTTPAEVFLDESGLFRISFKMKGSGLSAGVVRL